METVRRFAFDITDEFSLDMPINAQIYLVGVHDGKPCVWAHVETSLPKERRYFRLTGDEEPRPFMSWHIGSFQLSPYAWHLWGILPEKAPIDPPSIGVIHSMNPAEFRKFFGTLGQGREILKSVIGP